jgi:hypothetical protein
MLASHGSLAARGAYRGRCATSRSRKDSPVLATRCAATSIFMRAMSTPVGHSRLQALQPTHSFIASAIASLVSAPSPS